MPSVLTMPKSFDDVESPVLLDEDWYPMRLVKDPEIKPNGVLRTYMKDRGIKNAESALEAAINEGYTDDDDKYPGFNWVLSLRVIDEDPMINGRAFTVWLQLPNKGDSGRRNFEGQLVEDAKMETISKYLAAFHNGPPSGEEAYLEANMAAMFCVVQEPSFRDESKMVNSVDGNQDPQPYAG